MFFQNYYVGAPATVPGHAAKIMRTSAQRGRRAELKSRVRKSREHQSLGRP